jgi:hypothetical protein
VDQRAPASSSADRGLHLATPDVQVAIVEGYGPRVTAVHRVEAQQSGEAFHIEQVIDRDHFKRRIVDHELEDGPTMRPRPLMVTQMLMDLRYAK